MAAKFEPVKTLTSRIIPLMKEITIKTNQSIHLAIFTRGKILLLCTDLSLEPIEVIMLYGLRFKLELTFKNSVNVLGAYTYRFWLKMRFNIILLPR